jgi:two-component system, OmpR family, KDP operon response regulator KdpE
MPPRLLIVDDDVALTTVMSIGLKARGYAIDVAHDGSSALRTLGSQPSVVILDIDLPDRQGNELIREIRQQSKASIILCSGRLRHGDSPSRSYVGADGYLAKPFTMNELDRAIAHVLPTLTNFHSAAS